jgi:hypothetical protein
MQENKGIFKNAIDGGKRLKAFQFTVFRDLFFACGMQPILSVNSQNYEIVSS